MKHILPILLIFFSCQKEPNQQKILLFNTCHDVYFGGTDSIHFQGNTWCFEADSTFRQGRYGVGIDDPAFWGKWWMTDLNTGPNGWIDSMTIVNPAGDTVGYLATPLPWPHPFEVLLQRPGSVDVYLNQWP